MGGLTLFPCIRFTELTIKMFLIIQNLAKCLISDADYVKPLVTVF